MRLTKSVTHIKKRYLALLILIFLGVSVSLVNIYQSSRASSVYTTFTEKEHNDSNHPPGHQYNTGYCWDQGTICHHSNNGYHGNDNTGTYYENSTSMNNQNFVVYGPYTKAYYSGSAGGQAYGWNVACFNLMAVSNDVQVWLDVTRTNKEADYSEVVKVRDYLSVSNDGKRHSYCMDFRINYRSYPSVGEEKIETRVKGITGTFRFYYSRIYQYPANSQTPCTTEFDEDTRCSQIEKQDLILLDTEDPDKPKKDPDTPGRGCVLAGRIPVCIQTR